MFTYVSECKQTTPKKALKNLEKSKIKRRIETSKNVQNKLFKWYCISIIDVFSLVEH